MPAYLYFYRSGFRERVVECIEIVSKNVPCFRAERKTYYFVLFFVGKRAIEHTLSIFNVNILFPAHE